MIYPLNEGERQRSMVGELFSVAERRRLGQLSDLAVQLALIQGTAHPELRNPHLIVLASSHGFVQARSEDTACWATTCAKDFATGKHFVNALCRKSAFSMRIVDVGLSVPLSTGVGVDSFALRRGTRDFFYGPSMLQEEAFQALACGRQLANEAIDLGSNVLALGSLASGSRVSCALVAERLLQIGLDLLLPDTASFTTASLVGGEECQRLLDGTPRGFEWRDEVLRFGGFELIVAVGVMLQAAERRVVVLIDSFPMLTALAVAMRVEPYVRDYVVLAHMEQMRGMEAVAKCLGIAPVVRLALQTTEGVGCLLAYPILEAAVQLISLPTGEVGR